MGDWLNMMLWGEWLDMIFPREGAHAKNSDDGCDVTENVKYSGER